jgi:hypothetical protein
VQRPQWRQSGFDRIAAPPTMSAARFERLAATVNR